MASGANPSTPNLADPLAVALGLVNWGSNWGNMQGASAPASGTLYATALWLPFNKPITRLASVIVTAASGTAITAGYMGLCSPTAMVAQTATLGAAAASYPAGPLVASLAGSVTSYVPVPADSALGLYYVIILLNGTFGTTQPTFARGEGAVSAGNPIIGTAYQWAALGVGQAVLPANGAAVVFSPGLAPFAVACAP